jgi:hypothetical protein
MMKYATSYGTKGYYENLDVLKKSSIEIGGVDEFIKYTYDDLKDSVFFVENKDIVSRPFNGDAACYGKMRSAHYWIWKPYIILETMKLCEDDDVILYMDAGMKVVNNLNPLFEITKSNKDKSMVFTVSKTPELLHYHSIYTKRDCFILMGLDSPFYWDTRCINASISTWMKTPENIVLLTEWQEYMKDPRIVTEDGNTCGEPNLPGYKYHLHDQSVFSLLCTKYGREIYRDPSQYSINERGDFPNSPYDQLVKIGRAHV